MSFGDVTTTTTGSPHQQTVAKRPFEPSGPGTYASGPPPVSGPPTEASTPPPVSGPPTIPGPWLCVETASELMLIISLSIEQTVNWGHSGAGDVVSFGIFGEIDITGKSKRTCMPKEAAEAMVAAGQGCTSVMDQEYTSVSMGADPPELVPFIGGSSARLGPFFVSKVFGKPFTRYTYPFEKIKVYKMLRRPLGVTTQHWPDPEPVIPPIGQIPWEDWFRLNFQGPGRLWWDKTRMVVYHSYGRPFIKRGVSWEKVNLWDNWRGLLGMTGTFNHNFDLKLGYFKTCGPKICFECAAPDGTTTTAAGNICMDKQMKLLVPINITGTMGMGRWLSDQDSDTRRNGYLVFNDPYWYSGRAYPSDAERPIDLPHFTEGYGSTAATNPLVASEGPGYARYPGFGADIFEGNRQNDVSQGLHQIKLELQKALQDATSGWIGGFPVPIALDTDIFCGDMSLTDANIDQILADFARQWKGQSIATDKALLGPY